MKLQRLLILAAFITAMIIAGMVEPTEGAPSESRWRWPWGHTDADHHMQRNHPHSDHHPDPSRWDDDTGYRAGDIQDERERDRNRDQNTPKPKPKSKSRPKDSDRTDGDDESTKPGRDGDERDSLLRGTAHKHAGETGTDTHDKIVGKKPQGILPGDPKDAAADPPSPGKMLAEKANGDAVAPGGLL